MLGIFLTMQRLFQIFISVSFFLMQFARPLLLSSVGRLTKSGRQKRMLLTSMHGKFQSLKSGCDSLVAFFDNLKRNAPQLSPKQRWVTMLKRAMSAFELKFQPPNNKFLPLLT